MKTNATPVSCSGLQIGVLWFHYSDDPFPESVPYAQLLQRLQSIVGVEKLNQAIALIPNDHKRSNEELSRNLYVLDAFYERPKVFERLAKSAMNWEPEMLYADGEKNVIWIGGKLYRYYKDAIEDLLPDKPHPMMRSIKHGSKVTILSRFDQRSTGSAVMHCRTGGWVLDMGGAHGTTEIATSANVVQVED